MYREKLNQFKNLENLTGKAWQHAVASNSRYLRTTVPNDRSPRFIFS